MNEIIKSSSICFGGDVHEPDCHRSVQTLTMGRRLSGEQQCWHKEGSVSPIDKDYFCQEQHSWAYLKTMLINVRHCGYPSPLPGNKVLTAPLLN